jgi:hypothetical protein
MLDEKIGALARKTATLQLQDLDEPLARSIIGIKQKLRDYGHLWLYLMERYAQEVGRRADVIWRNLHRAHNSKGAPYSYRLRHDLREEFRAQIDSVLSDLSPRFQTDMKDAPRAATQRSWNAQLGDAQDRELARYEAEIEHYVASLETTRARGAEPTASYVVHGNVGAIVSGAGASANVVQNIATDQREALLKALELVKQTIGAAPDLVDTDRAELIDLAEEAAAEVSKEKPNGRRLGFALQSLTAAVQGIASGPGAYEVLRAAAAAIGVLL